MDGKAIPGTTIEILAEITKMRWFGRGKGYPVPPLHSVDTGCPPYPQNCRLLNFRKIPPCRCIYLQAKLVHFERNVAKLTTLYLMSKL